MPKNDQNLPAAQAESRDESGRDCGDGCNNGHTLAPGFSNSHKRKPRNAAAIEDGFAAALAEPTQPREIRTRVLSPPPGARPSHCSLTPSAGLGVAPGMHAAGPAHQLPPLAIDPDQNSSVVTVDDMQIAALSARHAADDESEEDEIPAAAPVRLARARSSNDGTVTTVKPRNAQSAHMTGLRQRRPSLAVAIQGDDEDFSTREQLAVRVARAAASLGQANTKDSCCSQGAWMPPMLAALSVAVLVVPLNNWVVWSMPNAWGVEGAAGWGQPSESTDAGNGFRQDFEVNEPVGAFLGVTALIYALIFASLYSEAYARIDEIKGNLVLEANGVLTAMLLVRTMDAGNDLHKTRVLLLFASYIEHLSNEMAAYKDRTIASMEEADLSHIETVYAAVPFLAKIADDGDGDEMDRVLVQRTIDMLNKVSEARNVRETAMQ